MKVRTVGFQVAYGSIYIARLVTNILVGFFTVQTVFSAFDPMQFTSINVLRNRKKVSSV